MAAIPRLRLVVLAAAVIGFGAACAGSGYTYHSNRDEQLFFKLPDSWTVFDTADLVGGGEIDGASWMRGFAAGDAPTAAAVDAITSDHPRGYVRVDELGVMERDGLNLAALRSTDFGVDPLTFAQENPEVVRVLGYEDDLVYDAGPHGVHIRLAITAEGSTTTAIVDQTVLVDKATTKRYVLSIGCSSACWDAHQRQIQEVIESWTLEKT